MVSKQDWVDSFTREPNYLDRRAFIMILALHAMDTILVFITIMALHAMEEMVEVWISVKPDLCTRSHG
jgi:hypothetical protein